MGVEAARQDIRAGPGDGGEVPAVVVPARRRRVVRFAYRFEEDCTMQFPRRMNRRQFHGGTIIEGIEVEYEYLGVRRRADIDLFTVIGIEATGECPLR